MLEVEARVVAAALVTLDLPLLSGTPNESTLPQNLKDADRITKRAFLQKLSQTVVERFIQNRDRDNLLRKKEYEDWLIVNNPTTPDGRFKCREITCSKAFLHDGKRRIEHEKTHGFHKHVIPGPTDDGNDEMYNYQMSFLDYGMLVYNFFDGVKEGDGARVIRCWKFQLLYLKNDGVRSKKYALEALYLQCQFNAMLSQKDARDLIWNRFHKAKFGCGGHIPLDLALEHFNNFLKTILRHLGPNATNRKAVNRYCNALTCNKILLNNFDKAMKVIRRSGKHSCKSAEGDLQKVVSQLLKENAMSSTNRRSYKVCKEMSACMLENLDMHAMYSWINDHKQNIYETKLAR